MRLLKAAIKAGRLDFLNHIDIFNFYDRIYHIDI